MRKNRHRYRAYFCHSEKVKVEEMLRLGILNLDLRVAPVAMVKACQRVEENTWEGMKRMLRGKLGPVKSFWGRGVTAGSQHALSTRHSKSYR